MFFEGWQPVLRTVAVGTLSYVALVALLRLSGKRTLSKWNAFDLVVTVALGSTLATALLSSETTLAQGAVAFALLAALQYGITWLSVRSSLVNALVKARPVYLLRDGRPCLAAMRRERVTLSEIRSAARGGGCARLEDVQAIVLETDGSFSVVRDVPATGASAMEDVAER